MSNNLPFDLGDSIFSSLKWKDHPEKKTERRSHMPEPTTVTWTKDRPPPHFSEAVLSSVGPHPPGPLGFGHLLCVLATTACRSHFPGAGSQQPLVRGV